MSTFGSTEDVQLIILIEGDDPFGDAFTIKISWDQSFSDLATVIQSTYRNKKNNTIFDLKLFKFELPDDEVKNFQFVHESALSPRKPVSSVWPPDSSIDRDLIHVIVQCQVASDPSKASVQPEDEINNVAKLLEDTQLAVIVKQREQHSSGWVQPAQFRGLQKSDGRILNGRPGDQAGLPISFYHPVFGGFLTNLASHEPLPAPLRILTRDLFASSQQVFKNENEREVATKELLESLLGEYFTKTGAKGVEPDGMITSRGGTCCVLMEIKNEIGSGGSDPSIQAATLYSKYWASPTMDPVRNQSCCPSLLISIAGPWMSILGAVFIDRPVMQPLTDFIWLGDNPQQPSRLDYVARVFHCVSLAREELQTYYRDLPLSITGKQLKRFFPYITSYPDSLGRRVLFSYTSKFARLHCSKAIFRATTLDTEDPKDIVVKFVQTYSAEAHRLLADHNLAPQLLYDGSESPNLGPGFSMIVMEFVSGVDLLHHTGNPIPERVRDDIKRALRLLHEGGFVFGDLRAPNVMLTKDANGKVTGGMLVDFDWCGRNGEGVYPTLMNREIDWVAGMEPDQLMDKDHDNVMLERLWLGMEIVSK